MKNEPILSWLSQLPETPDDAEVYERLTYKNGLFIEEEGQYWDFKDAWPFSLSNEYFGGIAKHICAFANSRGGIIVFGVHDKKRTGGHNGVIINFDRFLLALNQLTGALIPLSIRTYSDDERGDVTLLFIPPRKNGVMPFKFQSKLHKYKDNTLWVRVGHQTVQASPMQFPLLFCRAIPDDDYNSKEIDGSLPSPPATLKKFIGRVRVMEALFAWLINSDEPRTYLHGKGGSGKSTIAFEFVKLLKDFGRDLDINGTSKIDCVIYLSAKEKALNSLDGSSIGNVQPDFTSATDLIRQILFYSNWITDKENLDELSMDELKKEATDLFNHLSMVLVIDDIDTLTTKGIDAGSDLIFGILCRAKKESKVLYTLRNAPTQSLTNSIEVPGLDSDDYPAFVAECCKQFHVPEPPAEVRDGQLSIISERRPLVVESIIALHRTSGNYTRAIDYFEQYSGEHVRDYVFLREWNSLTQDSASRLLLAALADFKEPVSFSQLEAVMQIDASRLVDAIGATREMFLTVNQAGDDTLYSLASLTRQFVNTHKSHLHGYSALKQRINNYTRNVYIANPHVAQIAAKIEKIIPSTKRSSNLYSNDSNQEAWRIVTSNSLTPRITEDPLFKVILGYVACCQRPPKLSEAREAFCFAMTMKFEPEIRYLQQWYISEKDSGLMDGWCIKIADAVISGKKYTERDKIEMISRKASYLKAFAKDRLHTDHTAAAKAFKDALHLHLKAFRLNCLNGYQYAQVSETNALNVAYDLAQLHSGNSPWAFIDDLNYIGSTIDVYLDPIDEPLRRFMNIVPNLCRTPASVARFCNNLKGLQDKFSNKELWLGNDNRERVLLAINQTLKYLVNSDTRKR